VTPREALDRLAALCDEGWHENGHEDAERVIGVDDVRAVLAEVSPEPGGVLDRDQARYVLIDLWRDLLAAIARNEAVPRLDPYVDRLAGCVRPAAIDRDALTALILTWQPYPGFESASIRADAILALVRPVAGVTLTPEEADLVRRLVTRDPRTPWSTRDNARLPALAARLETVLADVSPEVDDDPWRVM
jgi:hypothetical protein